MRRGRRLLKYIGLLAIVLGMGSHALAQDGDMMSEPGDSMVTESTPTPVAIERSKDAADNYPLAYAARGLTMPQGMIRGEFKFAFGSFELNLGAFSTFDETIAALNFGAAISPVDNLEIGLSDNRMGWPESAFGLRGLLALVVQPDTNVGDIPLYVRYRFLNHDNLEIGIDLELNLPVLNDFGILVGLPIRIHASDSFAIDTGAAFTVSDLGGENVTGVQIPFGIVANFTDNIFLKAQTGVTLIDLSDIGGAVPVHAGLGYSMETGPAMVDIFGMFGFPTLLVFADGDSKTFTKIWELSVGLKVYTPVLF